MGLYKICDHNGRTRNRCEHAWWGSFRGIRVSLPKWANRDINTKAEAQAVLDEVRTAIRAGTFDARGQAPREVSPMTFREFADIYKERHAVAKKLSLARTIDWRIRAILERFGDWALTDIKTADVEDFIADLRKPRIVGRHAEARCLTPASINRTIELLRHMLNWAVGREYLEKTPFRRGTETLIRSCARTTCAVGGSRPTRNSACSRGCTVAPAIDDHHRTRHLDAPRRDAGTAIR
jgi:hypothetical protein